MGVAASVVSASSDAETPSSAGTASSVTSPSDFSSLNKKCELCKRRVDVEAVPGINALVALRDHRALVAGLSDAIGTTGYEDEKERQVWPPTPFTRTSVWIRKPQTYQHVTAALRPRQIETLFRSKVKGTHLHHVIAIQLDNIRETCLLNQSRRSTEHRNRVNRVVQTVMAFKSCVLSNHSLINVTRQSIPVLGWVTKREAVNKRL